MPIKESANHSNSIKLLKRKKMALKWYLEKTVILMIMLIVVCDGCREEERNALLNIKESYIDYSSNSGLNLTSWGVEKADCCQWERVICNDTTGHVERIYLSYVYYDGNKGMGGRYFNASLFLPLKYLRFLVIGSNGLVGCVENGGFERLSALKNLEAIHLFDNSLNNDIFSSFSSLPTLKELVLSRNKLKGIINFKEFNGFGKLESLDLSNNDITKLKGGRGLKNLYDLRLRNVTFVKKDLELQQQLEEFVSLTSLDLSFNNLTGHVFSGDRSFLQSVGVMTSLKSLYLRGCGLGGTLPSSQGICDLKHLEVLDLEDNDLHGPLPWCFSNLTSMRYLDLRNNQFSGNISPLGSLTSLGIIDLSNNNFRIPISLNPLFNLSKLSVFDAYGNEIYDDDDDDEMDYDDNSTPQFQLQYLWLSSCRECGGTFPKFLYYQHNLVVVSLSNNKLRGMFPNWLLENNTELGMLSLGNNSLTGNLRLPIRSSLHLYALDISNNLLNGQIRQDFGAYFPRMEYLSMSRNRFRGNIPSSFGNMTFLYSLDLSNNELSGAPHHYSLLSFNLLLQLDVSYNKFSGKIPQWIANSSRLSWLILSHNNFGGHLPIQLCNLQLVSLLDLSNNNLSGHIPPCLSAIAANQNSSYGPVDFTTKGVSYAFQTSILRYMAGIDLSNNKFTGPIPTEIGNLRELKVLNLSHNHLEGTIPQQLSKLEQIESLDISFNKLQGPIPQQLTQLHFLGVFNVSFNNLSGEIPYGTQFSSFPNSSYVANPFLCGLPLTKRCNATPTSPTTLVVSPSVDVGFVETEVLYVSFAIGYGVVVFTMIAVLCINPYWRRIWFGFIELCMNGCYYFFIDNLPCLYKFRYSQPCV